MNIIGRKEEQKMLTDCLDSGRPEFMVVYGRRLFLCGNNSLKILM